MTDPYDDPAFRKLHDFVGYGRLDAPIWFLGLEESVNRAMDFDHALGARITRFDATMDLAQGLDLLGLPFARIRKFNHIWYFAAKIARAVVDRAADWDDTDLARGYIFDRLGRADGRTLLTELLPLPKREKTGWPERYRRWFASVEDYEQRVKPARIEPLRALLFEHRPRLVVAYGKSEWESFKDVFAIPRDAWRCVPGTGGKLRIAHAPVAGTIAVLSPFLGQGQFSVRDIEALLREMNGLGAPSTAGRNPRPNE